MPAFILRHAGTKYFAGLYAADTEDDLYDLIDQEHDAGDLSMPFSGRASGSSSARGTGKKTVSFKIGKGHKALFRALATTEHVYLTGELLSAPRVWRAAALAAALRGLN